MPPSLPLEVQLLILENAAWEQHPTLSRVCHTWRQFITSPTVLVKRYTTITLSKYFDLPERHFERPRVHRLLSLLTHLRRTEADGDLEPCHRRPVPFSPVESKAESSSAESEEKDHMRQDSSQYLMLKDYIFFFRDPVIWPHDINIDETDGGNHSLFFCEKTTDLWLIPNREAEAVDCISMPLGSNPTVGEVFDEIAEAANNHAHDWSWGQGWGAPDVVKLSVMYLSDHDDTDEGCVFTFLLESDLESEAQKSAAGGCETETA
ncbi:hypothetical protein H072_4147 [Dactylellina haptotyla CBS 200.50]|uniref:F-box domain-containing protein n=1 Tax=Dactylellina haptotyla (strain CBS 200.50) TaxID=1284197 RepID=S8BR36_DACHA|nr:hypothetical protein H072_4147 [Dactylellina haptotyla CBS 200.50]